MMAEIIETVVESSHNEVKSRMAKKASQDKLDYIAQYTKEHRKSIQVYLNRQYDAELIEFWNSIPNKSSWIKSKLREDLEASKKAGK